MRFLCLLLIFLKLFDTVTSADVCRSGCKSELKNGVGLLRLEDGYQYTYNFESDARVSAHDDSKSTGAGSNKGGATATDLSSSINTEIRGQVLLTYRSNCSYAIQLRNVQLIVPSSKKAAISIENIERPVEFTIDGNGAVDDELCTDDLDTDNSMNVKRAIISLFQADLKSHYETDIFGRCATETSVRDENGLKTVTKSRQLDECWHRENIKQDFVVGQMDWRTPGSKYGPGRLLSATQFATEQKFRNGVLEYAKCSERYEYNPFSGTKGGSTSVAVVTKLFYQTKAKGAATTIIASRRPRSIIFEKVHEMAAATAEKFSSVDGLSKMLKETADSMKDGLTEHAAKNFGQLVRMMRQSTKNDLLTLYGQVKAGVGTSGSNLNKRLLFDALFRCGSAAASEVAIELFNNNELNEREQIELFVSLPLVQHVTPQLLRTIGNLLASSGKATSQPLIVRHGLMGVGAMVAQYCKMHANCNRRPETVAIFDRVADLLDEHAKQAARERNDLGVVTVLKAVRNMKVEMGEGRLLTAILKMANASSKDSDRLRVMALNALESSAANERVKEMALRLLADVKEDAEIRIQAYLLAVRCPCNKMAARLAKVLENEPSIQVGSFISSHLRTMDMSASTIKKNARVYLTHAIKLAAKNYPIDVKRYSFNGELAVGTKLLGGAIGGSGSSVETNVIYSAKSFVPRSVALNVTVEMFGKLVNVAELSMRQENLERVLEQHYGPVGSDRVTGGGFVDILNSFRRKRKADFRQPFNVDVAVKAFGNEMLFYTWTEKEMEGVSVAAAVTASASPVDEEDKRKTHVAIFDFQLAYPTGSGLALKFITESVSCVKWDSHLEKEADGAALNLGFRPGLNSELTATIAIDSEAYETGVSVSTSLLTSVALDIKYKSSAAADHKHSEFEIHLPYDKQVAASVRSRAVLVVRQAATKDVSMPVEPKQPRPQHNYDICYDQVAMLTGLNVCAKLKAPRDWSRMKWMSDVEIALWLEKSGDLTYYRAEIDRHARDPFSFDLRVSTPGSKMNRMIHYGYRVNTSSGGGDGGQDDKRVDAAIFLRTPFENFELSGQLLNGAVERSGRVSFETNQFDAEAKLGLKMVDGGDTKRVYEPIFVIRSQKNAQLVEKLVPLKMITGRVIVEGPRDFMSKKTYRLEGGKLVLRNQPEIELVATGTIDLPAKEFDLDAKLSQSSNSFSVKSHLKSPGDVAHKKTAFELEIENTANPLMNVRLQTEFMFHVHEMDVSVRFGHGPEAKSRTAFELRHTCRHGYESLSKFHFETENVVKVPQLQFDFAFDLLLKPQRFSKRLKLHYDANGIRMDSKAVFDAGSFAAVAAGTADKSPVVHYSWQVNAAGYATELAMMLSCESEKDNAADRMVSTKFRNEFELNSMKYSGNGQVRWKRAVADDVKMAPDAIKRQADAEFKLMANDMLITTLKLAANRTFDRAVFVRFEVENGKAERLINFEQQLDLKKPHVLVDFQVIDAVDLHLFYRKLAAGEKRSALLKFRLFKKLVEIQSDLDYVQDSKVVGNVQLSHNWDAEEKAPHVELAINGECDWTKGTNGDRDIKSAMKVMVPRKNWGFEHKLALKAQHDPQSLRLSAYDLEWNAMLLNRTDYAVHVKRHINYKNKTIVNGDVSYMLKISDYETHVTAKYIDTDALHGNFDVDYRLSVQKPDKKMFESAMRMKRSTDWTSGRRQTNLTASVMRHYREGAEPMEIEYVSKHEPNSKSYSLGMRCGAKNRNDLRFETSYDVAMVEDRKRFVKFELENRMDSESWGKTVLKMKGGAAKSSQADYVYESDLAMELDMGAEKGKIDGSLRAANDWLQRKFEMNGALSVPKQQSPLKLKLSHVYDSSRMTELQMDYDAGKFVRLVTAVRPAATKGEAPVAYEMQLEKTSEANNKEKDSIELKVVRSSAAAPNHYMNVTVTVRTGADDRTYRLHNELIVSETKPSFELSLEYPASDKRPTSRIAARLNRVAPAKRQFAGSLAVESVRGFSLDVKGDADLTAVDNFRIEMTASSERLNWSSLELRAENQHGKKIRFSAHNNKRVLLEGDADYEIREKSPGRFAVEGSGSYTIAAGAGENAAPEPKRASFKYVRQTFQQDGSENADESGIDIMLNVSFDNDRKAVVGEFKMTNKQFKLLNSYCEKANDCAHIEISSKSARNDAAVSAHEFQVSVDLKKLGFDHEFGMKSQTNRTGWLIEHTVDMHLHDRDETHNYQYSVYTRRTEAGVLMRLPNRRTVAIETHYELWPEEETKSGGTTATSFVRNPLRFEMTFYPNKELEAEKKVGVVSSFAWSQNSNAANYRGEWRLVAVPVLQKDLSIVLDANIDRTARLFKSNAEIDVFRKKSDKIYMDIKTRAEPNGLLTTEFKLNSKGLGIRVDYESTKWLNSSGFSVLRQCDYEIGDSGRMVSRVQIGCNRGEFTAELTAKNIELLKMSMGLVDVDGGGKKMHLKLNRHEADLQLKNMNTIVMSAGNADVQYRASGGFVFGQVADLRVESSRPASKKDTKLFHFGVSLDEANFLQPTHTLDAEAIKAELKAIQRSMNESLEKTRESFEMLQKQTRGETELFMRTVREHFVDLSQVQTFYADEISKFRDDLMTDANVRELVQMLRNFFAVAISAVEEVWKKGSEVCVQLKKMMAEACERVSTVYSERVAPTIRKLAQLVIDVQVKVIRTVSDIVIICLMRLTEILKTYQNDLNTFATQLSEYFREYFRAIFKVAASVRESFVKAYHTLIEEIKTSPFVENLNERFASFDLKLVFAQLQSLNVTDETLASLNDMAESLKDLFAMDDDWKQLVSQLHRIIEQNLRHNKDLDNWAELKSLWSMCSRFVQKFVNRGLGVGETGSANAVSLKTIGDWVTRKWQRLSSGSLAENLFDLEYSPKVRSFVEMVLSPGNFMFPTSLDLNRVAIVIESHADSHVYTFDQRHAILTKPKCAYVLAADGLDGNFTLTAKYDAKTSKLQSVRLEDRTKAWLELERGAKLRSSAGPSEFPLRLQKSIGAYRLFDSVHLVSRYGIRVVCSLDFDPCHVYVSGFYHGRLRGLLGNANYERYDDLKDRRKLAIDAKCDAAAAALKLDEKPGSNATKAADNCNRFFVGNPALALCQQSIDIEPFYHDCLHASAAGPREQCRFIEAYVQACHAYRIPVIPVPGFCVKCGTGSNDDTDFGSSISVKRPTKAADIVFVLDQIKDYQKVYESLIPDLMTKTSAELNKKGISDVKYILIGYGGGQRKWPSLYTNKNGQLKFDGKLSNIRFTDRKDDDPSDSQGQFHIHTGVRAFDTVVNTVLELIGDRDAIAYKSYRMARDFPFRPHASRAIVLFPHNCISSQLIYWARLQVFLMGGNPGVAYHTFTNVGPMTITNGPATGSIQASDILAFSKNRVQTVKSSSSSSSSSSAAVAYNQLNYTIENMCVDTTLTLGGTVYMAENYLTGGAAEKPLLDTFANNLVEDLAAEKQVAAAKNRFDCRCARHGISDSFYSLPTTGRYYCSRVR